MNKPSCNFFKLPVLGACIIVIFGLMVPAAAQETRTMEVLGSVDGVVDGHERAWLTISGEIDGAEMSSAAWKAYDVGSLMDAMFDGVSDAQRQQMQERMQAMSEMMGDAGAAHPFAPGSGEDQVTLRIMGVDPEAERILRQGMISIELPAFAVDDLDAMVGSPVEAEISYHKNFGEVTGFHASSHEAGTAAYVVFERLDIVEGGGNAKGRFGATLCSIGVLMRGDIDPDDCLFVEGHFDTALGEDPLDG